MYVYGFPEGDRTDRLVRRRRPGQACTGCGTGWEEKRRRDTGVPERENLSADYWLGGWVCTVHCRALLIRIERSGMGVIMPRWTVGWWVGSGDGRVARGRTCTTQLK